MENININNATNLTLNIGGNMISSNSTRVISATSTDNIIISPVSTSSSTHINVIDDCSEKVPSGLEELCSPSMPLPSCISNTTNLILSAGLPNLAVSCLPSTNSKHSHSLRRNVPRIIVKPVIHEKKNNAVALDGLNSRLMLNHAVANTTSTITSGTNASVRIASGSRRIHHHNQQLQPERELNVPNVLAYGVGSLRGVITPTNTSNIRQQVPIAITQASTMREVLASIPGFNMKPRRRSSKKISTAAQIEQTKDGKIDLETPDSILASTNLRALLNKQTFSLLPPLYQFNLIQLLPSVDRESIVTEHKYPPNTVPTETIKLGSSSLNNEFFARACLEWRERLSEGEFTPENQIKLKTEADRERNKLDPWKLKHFEPIWGEKSNNRNNNITKNGNNSHGSEIIKSKNEQPATVIPSISIVTTNSALNLSTQGLSFSSTITTAPVAAVIEVSPIKTTHNEDSYTTTIRTSTTVSITSSSLDSNGNIPTTLTSEVNRVDHPIEKNYSRFAIATTANSKCANKTDECIQKMSVKEGRGRVQDFMVSEGKMSGTAETILTSIASALTSTPLNTYNSVRQFGTLKMILNTTSKRGTKRSSTSSSFRQCNSSGIKDAAMIMGVKTNEPLMSRSNYPSSNSVSDLNTFDEETNISSKQLKIEVVKISENQSALCSKDKESIVSDMGVNSNTNLDCNLSNIVNNVDEVDKEENLSRDMIQVDRKEESSSNVIHERMSPPNTHNFGNLSSINTDRTDSVTTYEAPRIGEGDDRDNHTLGVVKMNSYMDGSISSVTSLSNMNSICDNSMPQPSESVMDCDDGEAVMVISSDNQQLPVQMEEDDDENQPSNLQVMNNMVCTTNGSNIQDKNERTVAGHHSPLNAEAAILLDRENVEAEKIDPEEGETVDDDLIEQNFADAENYILQSGELNQAVNSALSVIKTEANNNLPTSGLPAIAAITTTFSDSNFRYGGALNHNVMISKQNSVESCIQQNLLLNASSVLSSFSQSSLLSPISSSTSLPLSTSSSSASTASSTSLPLISLSEMKTIMSSIVSKQSALSSILPSGLTSNYNVGQQNNSVPVLTPKTSSIIGNNSCSGVVDHQQQLKNEICRHLQHDWNFGGLKLTPSQLQHVNSPIQVPVQAHQSPPVVSMSRTMGSYRNLIESKNDQTGESSARKVVIKLDGCLPTAHITAMRRKSTIGALTSTTANNTVSSNTSIQLINSEGKLQNIAVEEVVIDNEGEDDEDDDNDVEERLLCNVEEEEDDGNEENDDIEDDDNENYCNDDNAGNDDDQGDVSHVSDVVTIKGIVDELQCVPSISYSSRHQQQPQQIMHLPQNTHHAPQRVTDSIALSLPLHSLEGQFLQQQRHNIHHQIQQQQSQKLINVNLQTNARDYIGEMAAEIVCEVPITCTEMEVTSTVVTNNSCNDSTTELSICSSNSSSGLRLTHASHGPVASLIHNHIQQPPHAPTQRQILVDSNGQIIGNFLVQQQQREHQQQLLHQAAQQISLQTAHQQGSVATFNTRPYHHAQSHQQTVNPHQAQIPTKLLPVMRKTYEINTNGANQSHVSNAIAPNGSHPNVSTRTAALTGDHYVRESVAPTLSQLTLHHQQSASHSKNNANSTLVGSSEGSQRSNSFLTNQQQHRSHQLQLQYQMSNLQTQLGSASQQLQQRQLQLQQQGNLSVSPKYIAKQLSIISLPNHSTAPTIAIQTPATAAAPLLVNASASATPQLFNTNTTNDITSALKTLMPNSIPTTVSQLQKQEQQHAPRQMLSICGKQGTQKGRKTTSKLPPGAVNLERSYQICQAVIQNSPNRENLRAQLRPPAALLLSQQNQQLQQSSLLVGGSDAGQQQFLTTVSSTRTLPLVINHKQGLKVADDMLANNVPTGLHANVMGIGRPGVYKVIGPRTGFPRKKYVQRKSSPTLIRHVFTPTTATAADTALLPSPLHLMSSNGGYSGISGSIRNCQNLSTLLQHHVAATQQQQNLELQQHHHNFHNSGGPGHYVLVHRANIGVADNQAPRASSAPPVPQNQNPLNLGINGDGSSGSGIWNNNSLDDKDSFNCGNDGGTSILDRGRPASVDVDTTLHNHLKNLQNYVPPTLSFSPPSSASLLSSPSTSMTSSILLHPTHVAPVLKHDSMSTATGNIYVENLAQTSLTARNSYMVVNTTTLTTTASVATTATVHTMSTAIEETLKRGNHRLTCIRGGDNTGTAFAETEDTIHTTIQSLPLTHAIRLNVTKGQTNCGCSLNAMVICQQCGAFCHNNCINAAKLCLSCVIRCKM